MTIGTLLIDEQGHYCPACGFRPSLTPRSSRTPSAARRPPKAARAA
jgi:hypothetical protein